MKLITSYIQSDIRSLTEAVAGKKRLFIEGVFLQAEKPNRNKRVYPRDVMEAAVNKYITEQVKTNRAVGEINHPEEPTVNYDRVSHRITDLRWDGDNVIGKALILDTPMGQIARGLIEGGVQVGVSSRGMGSVEEGRSGISMVQDDYFITAIDIVQDPSAPEAFVNGIMEGVEFYLTDTGSIVAEKADRLKRKLHKLSPAQITEQKTAAFQKFLNDIKNCI